MSLNPTTPSLSTRRATLGALFGLRTFAGASLLLAGLAACSGGDDNNTTTSTGSSSSASASSGAGGGGGAESPCAAGSHLGADGACEANITAWSEGPSLNGSRDHHVTFIAETDGGAVLYVLGGV